MEIRLKNIGIVKDSTITVDGLTIITGKNNSGKTTVGKTLYALLEAVSNIQAKARGDRAQCIIDSFDEVTDTLDMFRYLWHVERGKKESEENNPLLAYPAIYALITRNYKFDRSYSELELFAHRLYDELLSLDIKKLSEEKPLQGYLRHFVAVRRGANSIIDAVVNQRDKAVAVLDKLFSVLDKDPQLIEYARESINQTLRQEFSNQIQPVSVDVESSKVEISNDGVLCFNINIANNNVVNDGSPVFTTSPYKKVYLIDDPFLMDDFEDSPRMIRHLGSSSIGEINSILNPRNILSHNEKLKYILRRKHQPSILEQTVLNESLKKVKQEIDSILPGSFEFSPDGAYYVQNGHKLNVSNLATGSKMFSIIKILIDKGEIDNSTMLILDEPEAHLHPSWQNHFAEVIVLLVKELNVNILLTTHSSNFVLALDAYMRKHSIEEKTNFYQTNFLEDHLVEYACANDDIGSIYQDFLAYLSEVKMLRNECIRSAGDN